jgi:uncharacterized protein YbjT (DUF2867 family)
MTTTLIVGASGTVGSELARLLATAGHTVRRATSRTPTAPDQVRLDLVTHEGLAQAFEGVDRAFLLSPPGHTNQHELLGPLIEHARTQRLDKLVLMTAMGADADATAPLRRAELQLEASDRPFNVIRPNWFMQNFHTFWLAGIREHGTIFLPTGTARGSFIDARDIAAVATALLGGHAHDGAAFDLTGARALDHDEAAAILSRAAGHTIRYQDIPPEAMLAGLLGAGLPRPYAEFLVTILGTFKAGYAERVTDAVPAITGRAPITFERYAEDHRAHWQAPGA